MGAVCGPVDDLLVGKVMALAYPKKALLVGLLLTVPRVVGCSDEMKPYNGSFATDGTCPLGDGARAPLDAELAGARREWANNRCTIKRVESVDSEPSKSVRSDGKLVCSYSVTVSVTDCDTSGGCLGAGARP